MRIIQKLLVILFALFFSQSSLTAFSNFNTVVLDTIPEVVQVYTGNRIKVKGIKINKRKGQSIKISYNLVNTGRNKIKLGKKRVPPSDLIIEFDSSLEKNDLVDAKSAIIENLKKQNISIRPGQLIMGSKLKFENRPIPPSDRIVEVENNEPTEEKMEQVEEIIEKDIVANEPAEEEVVTPIIETVENTVEVENPIEIESPSPEKIDETILVKTESPKKFDGRSIENTEVKVEEEIPTTEVVISETTPIEEEIEVVNVETPVIETEEETIVETPIVKKIDELTIDTSTIATNPSNEKQCPDLAVVNVEIVKKNRRNVTLKYTITNLGNIPIALLGETKKEEDNISIQVYFTRSEKLTRGAIPVKSFFLKKGLKNKGILEPNASYSGKIKVETTKMTKFTPIVAFSIDAHQDTFECTRINNVSFVNITENAAPKSDNPLPAQPLEAKESEVIGANDIKN